jgi:hypothetical protein
MKFIAFTLAIFLLGIFHSTTTLAQDKNKSIIAFVNKNLNKKIDRGECWDLVAFALNEAKADWKAPLDFGDEIKYPKTDLKPGDIISFENVKFEFEGGYVTFPQHYAIVYEVKNKNEIVIVHQNHNNIRKVQKLDLDLSTKTKGTIKFYQAR